MSSSIQISRKEKRELRFIWAVILGCCLFFQLQAVAEPLSSTISGNAFEYTVLAGDTLTKVGARFGVDSKVLARENALKYNAKLAPEQKLLIDNRHIVPEAPMDDLLINLPQRMLYYHKNGELIAAYPVGLGRPSWKTPLGDFSVTSKVANKTWLVPKSIQEEMRREGKAVKTQVPPGPNNPLGKYWLGLSLSGIGIHGTIAPASIYQFQSHGCIRLHPDDIEALFMQVERGVTGSVSYMPLLIAELEGKIFVEVHQDIYHNGDISMKALEQMALDAMLTERIDWERAKNVLEQRDGIARDVTLLGNTQAY